MDRGKVGVVVVDVPNDGDVVWVSLKSMHHGRNTSFFTIALSVNKVALGAWAVLQGGVESLIDSSGGEPPSQPRPDNDVDVGLGLVVLVLAVAWRPLVFFNIVRYICCNS